MELLQRDFQNVFDMEPDSASRRGPGVKEEG